MPKKYSHQNPPEPEEYRKRAVKLFWESENDEGVTPKKNAPQNEIEIEDESLNAEFDFESENQRSKIRTAKDYALYLVSVNTYTEKKLRIKLESKKRGGESAYTSSEIAEAIDFVKSFGYINDLRLAQNSLPGLAARCWGKVKIRYYLIKNGIDEDIVDSLDYSDIDFVFYCRKLLEKNASKSREKQYRVLYNAGYTEEEIRETLLSLERK